MPLAITQAQNKVVLALLRNAAASFEDTHVSDNVQKKLIAACEKGLAFGGTYPKTNKMKKKVARLAKAVRRRRAMQCRCLCDFACVARGTRTPCCLRAQAYASTLDESDTRIINDGPRMAEQLALIARNRKRPEEEVTWHDVSNAINTKPALSNSEWSKHYPESWPSDDASWPPY